MKQLTPEQLERLKPESRERYEQRLRTVKRNRKIATIGGLCVIIILAVVIISTTVLFNITAIKVAKPGANYTANEIISASGLNAGDNMIRTDFKKSAERIETNLPYVLEATISKKLSGEVSISIKDTSAAILIELDEGYAIADIRGKVLEIVEKAPKDNTFMLLKTSKTVNAVPGTFFNFADDNEKMIYEKIIKELENTGIYENITSIDISDHSSVKIEYQNRLRLLIGTTQDLDVKLKGAVKAITAEDNKDPTLIAEINLTIPKKVFVNPVEYLYPPEDEDDTPEDVTDTTDEAETTSVPEEKTTDKPEEGTTEPEVTTEPSTLPSSTVSEVDND